MHKKIDEIHVEVFILNKKLTILNLLLIKRQHIL